MQTPDAGYGMHGGNENWGEVLVDYSEQGILTTRPVLI